MQFIGPGGLTSVCDPIGEGRGKEHPPGQGERPVVQSPVIAEAGGPGSRAGGCKGLLELVGHPGVDDGAQRRNSPINSWRWRSLRPPTVFEGAIRHWVSERAALTGPTFGSASRRS
jgi:hypothetical protein